MKKFIYSIVLLLGTFTAVAQENRGTLIPAKIFQRSLLVGGSVSGAYRSLDNHMNNETSRGVRQQFDFDGMVGYFVLHDVAIGAKVTLNHARFRNNGDSPEMRSTYLLAGPFARYYLDNGFYGEGSFGVGRNNDLAGSKANIMEVAGGVGYALFINPKVALEPALHLSYLKEERHSGGARHFSEFGPTLSIGLQIYLYRERGLAAMR
ncbi:hypothetical protein [Rufibacter roseus]|uniref:Outer membrane protein beta-barrel domain-containing protein n=1 Tax=Rufibacter roseus TaxID=1567108 RepID=A0ABW2DPE9_9BACT|nr:hypothetical protein [Rufibacter roseus]